MDEFLQHIHKHKLFQFHKVYYHHAINHLNILLRMLFREL